MPNYSRLFSAAAVAAAITLVSGGCSGNSKVQGTVKHKSEPVAGAMVSLLADDGNVVASGMTDATGNFTLMTPQGKEAIPPGTYKATVTKLETPKGFDADKMKVEEGGKNAGDMAKMMKGMTAKPPKSVLPEKFRTKETTPLKVTVPSKSPITLDLDS
jgi:Carboxypeptidase regulatory-like domain